MRPRMRTLGAARKESPDGSGCGPGAHGRGAGLRVLARGHRGVADAPAQSVPQMEQRLARVREIAAAVPGKQEILKKVAGDLETREKGLIRAETAPQAQAQVVTILRGLGAAEVAHRNPQLRAGRHHPFRRRLRRGERLDSSRMPHRAAAQFPGRSGRAARADRHPRSARDGRRSEAKDVERPHHRGRHRAEESGAAKEGSVNHEPQDPGLESRLCWRCWGRSDGCCARTGARLAPGNWPRSRKPPRRSAQLPPPSPAPPEAVVPANYLDVAQKTLFSKDRNPNVIIETAASSAAQTRGAAAAAARVLRPDGTRRSRRVSQRRKGRPKGISCRRQSRTFQAGRVQSRNHHL